MPCGYDSCFVLEGIAMQGSTKMLIEDAWLDLQCLCYASLIIGLHFIDSGGERVLVPVCWIL